MTSQRVSVFGARDRVRELQTEVERLTELLSASGALSVEQQRTRNEQLQAEFTVLQVSMVRARAEHEARLAAQTTTSKRSLDAALASLTGQIQAAETRLAGLQSQVVVTEELAILQEVGIYQYRHPLDDAIAYRARLTSLQDTIKTLSMRDGGAVLAATGWAVNGSLAQGRTMIANYSKLVLRAYNAEADNLVRGLKPYKLASAIERLKKVDTAIVKLGVTMSIRIAPAYQQARVQELELTADYLAKVAEEKERDREAKARLREERVAQQELERERQRLLKEQQHYANAHAQLVAMGDHEAAERLGLRLTEIGRSIDDVDYRAANIRAGWVYVISNVGAFGEGMVKVGLTRRLEPRDRVRELGDASVPFRFDIHALVFSRDAVGIETELHHRLHDRRVNMVNPRREFFYATPTEVKAHLAQVEGDLLEFTEAPDAIEFRQSQATRNQAAGLQLVAPDLPYVDDPLDPNLQDDGDETT